MPKRETKIGCATGKQASMLRAFSASGAMAMSNEHSCLPPPSMSCVQTPALRDAFFGVHTAHARDQCTRWSSTMNARQRGAPAAAPALARRDLSRAPRAGTETRRPRMPRQRSHRPGPSVPQSRAQQRPTFTRTRMTQHTQTRGRQRERQRDQSVAVKSGARESSDRQRSVACTSSGGSCKPNLGVCLRGSSHYRYQPPDLALTTAINRQI